MYANGCLRATRCKIAFLPSISVLFRYKRNAITQRGAFLCCVFVKTQKLEDSYVSLKYSSSTGTLHVASTLSLKIKTGVGQGTINLQWSFHEAHMLL
jgi:hypothetical protein